MVQKYYTSWKRGLLVFGILFLASCVVSVLTVVVIGVLSRGGGASAGGSPRFIGTSHYLRLWLEDDTFLKALWNTIRWPLLAGVCIAAGLMVIKIFTASWRSLWDRIAYGVIFLGMAVFWGCFLSALFGYPSFIFPQDPLMSYRAPLTTVLQHIAMYTVVTMPLAVMTTCLLWCIERAVLYIIHYIRRRQGNNG